MSQSKLVTVFIEKNRDAGKEQCLEVGYKQGETLFFDRKHPRGRFVRPNSFEL